MKYFIPAWYDKEKWWRNQSVPFYHQRKISEFDEMISLMHMHHQNNVDFQTLVLNYHPDLRTFLHRHDLFEINYWSLFDDIQGFQHQTPKPIDFKVLKWPEGTEFVYTPYLVRCITDKNEYSNIYFNQDGYIVWVEVFEQKVRTKRYILDDRGFLSAIRYFDSDGHPEKQEYMTINGDCILTENIKTDEVMVAETYLEMFNTSSYARMDLLIQEKLAAYLTKRKDVNAVIIAADERHNTFLSSKLESFKICFSIFKNRNYPMSETQLSSIKHSDYWLVDLVDSEQMLEKYKIQQDISSKIMRITPFDAQVFPNISSQLYETYIGIWIDGLSDEALQTLLNQMIIYIGQNDDMRIILLSQKEAKDAPTWLKEQIKEINDSRNTIDETEDSIAALLAEEEEYITVIELEHVPFETDIIEIISKLRIIIDLNQEPNLFLQISSISACIPQINIRHTDYVKDKVNGLVISDINSVLPALDYFLGHLKNWNYAYAYSIKLVEAFASEKIIERLNHFIEGDL
ncbi:accessory Sec system protein Asp1 [Staphylococcus edaphicus]|uniref:Accessory Sec system protein Asp1 n=1 Tax=Staphylococcus edaphicus TaxID=1955013 RepID=A0A2C6WRP6_9STAP|nr:accessory Sec system protein Asp1 [Staphylococcus edaphicus]PHK50137.1 accessory Sec system protein Asp1 [Staphylococcus edaphicus]UQW81635.1 accessory Sec system protein Asp1 [Staphylococcus edaphicus]